MAMLPLLLVLACGGTAQTHYTGTKITPDLFPLDGARWTYVNRDPMVGWAMTVEKVQPPETLDDGATVWTLEYAEEGGDALARVKWSAKGGSALRIHAWAPETGSFEVFEPPIALTPEDGYMERGETVATETGGLVFVATLLGTESCTTPWDLDGDWTCAHFALDDGDAADAAGTFFAGEYGLVEGYGVAWMRIGGWAQPWELADYVPEPR